MKPAPFDYVAVGSLEEAVAELQRSDGDGKLLAGGQSLVPLLNMRLASPSRLIDLNRVPGLAYVKERDGGFAIGAMTRDAAVERDHRLRRRAPLLWEAIRWVGHPQIRSRGTVGGSLAHADPAAELPAVALCLDAALTAVGPTGTRRLPAAGFYTGYLGTLLAPDEVLTEAWFPHPAPRTGQAWLEFARRHGDYAIVGTGVSLTLGEDGLIRDARVALAGVAATPVRAPSIERALVGSRPTPDDVRAAAEAVRGDIEPEADIHGSRAYRQRLAAHLVGKALATALERAARSPDDEALAQDLHRTFAAMAQRA
jgi:aerobic carbon-monoxide dehydrogenase medium subunit